MLILVRDFLRRNFETVGEGISQIVLTLSLADGAIAASRATERRKAIEISMLIVEIIGFIIDHLHVFAAYMNDDFEGLLTLLASLQTRSSPEVLGRAYKYQKEVYNLFWAQADVQPRFQTPEAVFAKITSIADNSTKLYFASENIFFQRSINRVHFAFF